MLRHLTSFALCLLLATAPALAQTATADAAKEEALKKRVVEWGTNRNVTVKLKSGEKVKGRIAEISDEHFAVQFVEKGKVTSREVRYSEIKGISEKGSAGDIAAGVAIGSLAAIGVVAIFLLVAITNN
ncbi:MAG: hypothetical protein U0Z53_19395 [Blastocatellia bacterium]